MLEKVKSVHTKLRQTKPLVLCLTNYVSMDFVANSLLSSGGAPLMSADPREFEDLIKISHALYINIGTLDEAFIKGALKAANIAKRYAKPIVLDPVGSGASSLRTQAATELIHFSDIVRGNASEILSLFKEEFQTEGGVESTHDVDEAKETAKKIALRYGCTVVTSGEVDFLTDGKEKKDLHYGSPLMGKVTGMGCSLTAVIAAFRAIISNSFEASLVGTAYFGLCGQVAAKKQKKPGAFRTAFIDELHDPNLPSKEEDLF